MRYIFWQPYCTSDTTRWYSDGIFLNEEKLEDLCKDPRRLQRHLRHGRESMARHKDQVWVFDFHLKSIRPGVGFQGSRFRVSGCWV